MSWQEMDQKLWRRFEFTNFAEALAFVNKIGELAETAKHHPDISLGWGYAEVALTTHSESKVTQKDRYLAKQIESILLD